MVRSEDCNNWRFLIFGLYVYGILLCSAFGKPSSSTPTANLNDDYQYNDDEESIGPGEQVKPTMSGAKTTALPYFEKNMTTVFVKPNDTEISLKCPAKNLGESNVILWYQENNPITNGLQVLNSAYKVDSANFNLVISNLTASQHGNYYCEVLPQKIRLHTIIRVATDADQMTSQSPIPELAQSKKAATATEPDASSSGRLASLSLSSAISTILVMRISTQIRSALI